MPLENYRVLPLCSRCKCEVATVVVMGDRKTKKGTVKITLGKMCRPCADRVIAERTLETPGPEVVTKEKILGLLANSERDG